MIDPRRQRHNDEVAGRLLALQAEMTDRLWEGDPDARRLIDLIHQGSVRWRSPLLNDGFLAPKEAFEFAESLREMSIDPLREGIRQRSPRFTLSESEYETRAPLPSLGPTLLSIIAPLTWHVCIELLIAAGQLTILINDPSAGEPLAVERARYASERTELLSVEHTLWRLAATHGGPSKVIPYPYRLVLMALAWDPVAHQAPSGAWTLCVRCGELLHRRRRSVTSLPHCPPCMKETPAQRTWPDHALVPHSRGTWVLRCRYPNCETLFIGPRHRKLCDDHTSASLTPARRLARQRPSD
jgi:hypothetical protein